MSIFSTAQRFGLIFALILAGVVSIAQASPESEFEIHREQERKNYQTMIASMPALDARSPGELFGIGLEKGVLVVRTRLSNTVGSPYVRVKVGDGENSALVHVQDGASTSDRAPVVPGVFQFSLTDYSQPLRITTISVNAQASYCSISQSSQFPGGGFSSISMVQQNDRFSAGGPSIRLTVNEWDRQSAAPLDIELQAGDFGTLLREHAGWADEYIRPLLRELGQESLFAPDAMIAWQVFAEIWKPQPAVTQKVQNLLPGLDADDFHARAQASRELEKLGRDGAAVLIRLDRSRFSPEQNARIDLALAPYTQLPAKQAARLKSDPAFLLDCLYGDDATVKQAALARLRQVCDPLLQFDPSADTLSRNAAIAALRLRLTPTAKPCGAK